MDNLAKCPFCGSRTLAEGNTDCMDNVQEYAHIIVCGDCGTRGPWGKQRLMRLNYGTGVTALCKRLTTSITGSRRLSGLMRQLGAGGEDG